MIGPLPTPNPARFLVQVWASAEQVFQKMGNLVARTTTLKEFQLAVTPGAQPYGAYVYLEAEGPNDEGQLGFIFGQVLSDEEKAVAFEEFPTEDESFPWPKIVESFKIYCDNDDPKWTELRDNKQAYLFVVTKRVRPSFRGATKIIVRRYWSHEPWEVADFESEPMEPNNLEWDLMVLRGAINDCLHGAIKIPGLTGDGVGNLYNLADANPTGTAVAAYPARNYGATNYTTWEDHIYLTKQRPLRGGYLLETYEAKAPPLTPIEP